MIGRWLVPPASRSLAAILVVLYQFGMFPVLPAAAQAEDARGFHVLRAIPLTNLRSIFPSDVHILIERNAIEAFLVDLDRIPPDWATIYGGGAP